jgi:hypothetical protein
MPKKLPYHEGTLFAVTLCEEMGYVVGLVARAGKKGRVIYCYFFGPPRMTPPAVEELEGLRPEQSCWSAMIGDLNLYNGRWPILGEYPNWRREEWAMPQFVRREPGTNPPRAWRVYYDDNDPAKVIREEPEPYDSQLPKDSLSGAGAVEIHLTKRLKA